MTQRFASDAAYHDRLHWAGLLETGDRRLEIGDRLALGGASAGASTGRRLEWRGSLVCPGSSGQALLGAALPNIPYIGRGGSGPVDDVGGPGG